MKPVHPAMITIYIYIYIYFFLQHFNKALTCKMSHRSPALLERLALRVLYDLATKVPKVILQRVEEVIPAIKIQIVSSTTFRMSSNTPVHLTAHWY
jgi:hypothetical protein